MANKHAPETEKFRRVRHGKLHDASREPATVVAPSADSPAASSQVQDQAPEGTGVAAPSPASPPVASPPSMPKTGAAAPGAKAAPAAAAASMAKAAPAASRERREPVEPPILASGWRSDPDSPREHFIPVQRDDLLRALTADLTTTAADADRLRRICQLLEEAYHLVHYRRYRGILATYAPFDPDADTHSLAVSDPAERSRAAAAVCDKLASLLLQANFRRLDREEINEALEAASDWGLRLRVNFAEFERLEVYARGEGVIDRQRRSWRTLFRHRPVEVPVYQRLAIVFRFRDEVGAGAKASTAAVDGQAAISAAVPDTGVRIKLFKNIPKYDIEMLLPGVEVRMTWLDRGRIILPTISGLALTAYKIIRGAIVIAFAGAYGFAGMVGLIIGTLGYGVKSLMGYLRTKDKYHLQLTQNLYYRNLDNNAGALFRIVAEAEEQEMREVMLAYFLLWRDAGPEGWTARQLDEACESFLLRLLGSEVDFEVGDAIRKLEQLRLVDSRPGHRWTAISLDETYRRLQERWQTFVRELEPH
ncbi:MAG: hypothetical protein RLY70_4879 [Planctomycetota bacterium]